MLARTRPRDTRIGRLIALVVLTLSKVIGHWSCYGWWLDASVQLNTHLFTFGPAWGEAKLTSEGYSVGDLNVPVERPLTGGTGPYAGASGVQVETLLGINASNGGNFRYEIRLAGP